MNRPAAFILVCLIAFAGGHTVTAQSQAVGSGPEMADDRAPAPDTLRKLPNTAYRGGEQLKFSVHWSFVTAGDAYLTVTDTVYGGRKCNIVTFRLESKPFFDAFYKVREDRKSVV